MIDLTGWQERLQRQFTELRRRRSLVDSNRPVFGLEHGLGESEREELSATIREEISRRRPSKMHWLPWVVYACEIGYRFSGDEYWQTFEAETPGWRERGKQAWIRARFKEFRREFGGAEPSGPWAKKFTIICWPITNAILPIDLQRHLARVLYEVRHMMSYDALQSPRVLGELIAARSGGKTARFQNLAQSPLLVGQIAAALLLPEEKG